MCVPACVCLCLLRPMLGLRRSAFVGSRTEWNWTAHKRLLWFHIERASGRHSGGSRWKVQQRKNIIIDYLTTYQTAGRVCSNWESLRGFFGNRYVVIENKCNSRRWSDSRAGVDGIKCSWFSFDNWPVFVREEFCAACRIILRVRSGGEEMPFLISHKLQFIKSFHCVHVGALESHTISTTCQALDVMFLLSLLLLARPHPSPDSGRRWWITIKSFKLLII